MKFTFTKTARHRTFSHTPIYYDQAKEERVERERHAREELGLLTDEEKETGYSDRIRGGMKRRMKSNFDVSRKAKRASNIRLIIILIILMILASYLVRSGQEWFNQLVGN